MAVGRTGTSYPVIVDKHRGIDIVDIISRAEINGNLRRFERAVGNLRFHS